MSEANFLAQVQEHQGILYKICRLYRDTKEDREDLFQEIVFQLWKAFPGFKGDARISTWIYRVALNTAIASFRKKRPNIVYAPEIPDVAEEGENEALALQQERLFTALRQLDDGEKAVMALYLEGFTYRQIAETTGIDENYAGVKLNRIKNKIQKLLK